MIEIVVRDAPIRRVQTEWELRTELQLAMDRIAEQEEEISDLRAQLKEARAQVRELRARRMDTYERVLDKDKQTKKRIAAVIRAMGLLEEDE